MPPTSTRQHDHLPHEDDTHRMGLPVRVTAQVREGAAKPFGCGEQGTVRLQSQKASLAAATANAPHLSLFT